jgi:hypothetical protein
MPEYKRWLRKFLRPEDRVAHPFTLDMAKSLIHEKGVNEVIRDLVNAKAKAMEFNISEPGKDTDDGSPDYDNMVTLIMPQKRMKVLGTIVGHIYKNSVVPRIMNAVYGRTDYSWTTDPFKYLKSKEVQKKMKEFMNSHTEYFESLTPWGVNDNTLGLMISEGCKSIGVTATFDAKANKFTNIVDPDAIAANEVRAAKKKRGPKADFNTRYGALYEGVKDRFGADAPWSRKTDKKIGTYNSWWR